VGLWFKDMMDRHTDSEMIGEARARILGEIGPDVTLVAASKRQPDRRIEAILSAGQRVFGENRVQEAETRWGPRKASLTGLELRLIGPLQTNKAEAAVRLFDVIETLDRPKLLKALVAAVERTGVPPPDLLIQVNTGEEPQKAGVTVAELANLVALTREMWPGRLVGLMCIPPVEEPAGPHFALLRQLAEAHGLSQLSMGMSADYALAARLGATHVRVGSGLFGAREALPPATA
jgi:pyridoxal phosphate enzyme (YggS family)